jgi:hypothetical protein
MFVYNTSYGEEKYVLLPGERVQEHMDPVSQLTVAKISYGKWVYEDFDVREFADGEWRDVWNPYGTLRDVGPARPGEDFGPGQAAF